MTQGWRSIAIIALFLGGCFFRPSSFLIPIEINSYQIPYTFVEIKGDKYQVEIDFGTKMALSLHREVLEKIQKRPCGTSRRFDFRGNKYETPLYFISNVKIETLLLKKVKAREESLDFVANSVVVGAKENLNVGRIGRDFFAGKNIFMDFGHRVLIVCNHLKEIGKKECNVKNLVSLPFKTTTDGFVLEIETDMGKQKFALDTGTTLSILRAKNLQKAETMPVVETSKFIIGGFNFGPRELRLLEISSEFEVDGLLGMDFLGEYTVYLDFVKKVAYIGKTAPTAL